MLEKVRSKCWFILQTDSGISRILKVYDKDIFRISDHFIKILFPFAVIGIDRGIDNLFGILNEKPTITIKDISEQFGFSVREKLTDITFAVLEDRIMAQGRAAMRELWI